jgi:hypothetical protein
VCGHPGRAGKVIVSIEAVPCFIEHLVALGSLTQGGQVDKHVVTNALIGLQAGRCQASLSDAVVDGYSCGRPERDGRAAVNAATLADMSKSSTDPRFVDKVCDVLGTDGTLGSA